MPKPSDLPVWSTDTNYVGGPENGTPTKLEPSGGKQAVGHLPSEFPRPQYMNWWQNLVYLWLAYFDAGIWDGDLEVDGDLLVDQDAGVTGDLTVGGDIDALGDVHVTGSLEGVGGDPVPCDAGVEATVYYHTTAIPLHIPASTYVNINQENSGVITHIRNHGSYTLAASTDPLTIPIMLPKGSVITAYELSIVKSSGVGEVHNSRLYKVHEDCTHTALAVGHANAENAPGQTFMTESGLSIEVEQQYAYHLLFTPDNGGGDQVGFCKVYYTHPAPP